LWLVFLIASARILGPEDFGVYALATVMVSIVFIVFESGIDVNTMKRLAVGTGTDPKLVSVSLFSKLLVFGVCGITLWFGSWFAAADTKAYIQLAIPIAILQFGVIFIRHLFRGCVWFDLEARSIVTERALTIVAGSLALWLYGDLASYMTAFIAAYVVITIVDWRRFRARSGMTVSYPGIGPVLSHIRRSATIGVYNALSVLFTRISTVAMHFGGIPAADIGRFNSGIRLFDSFALLPTIVSDPLYPRICSAIRDKDELTSILRFPTVLLFSVTTLASSLVLTHHGIVVGWILGDAYTVASFEIALVFSTIILFSLNTITTKLIIAAEREVQMSKILGALLLSQLAFLYVAITGHGLTAVVWVYVVHEALYNLILAGLAYQLLHAWRLIRDVGLVALSAVLPAGVVLFAPIEDPMLAIPFQATAMGLLLMLTGIFRWDQVRRLWTYLRS
jgi:O-antigen/teichoic acid export membrane protein